MDTTTIAIAVIAAAVLLLLFARRKRPRMIGLGKHRPTTARQRMEAEAGSLSAADLAEIEQALAAGRKIEAIRLVRKATGVGLKEAKEFVEHHDPGRRARTGDPWGEQ